MKFINYLIVLAIALYLGKSAAEPLKNSAFNQSLEREQMLMTAVPISDPELTVLNLNSADENMRNFLNFFSEKIWPHLKIIRQYFEQEGFYYVALDRALYSSEAEKLEWQKKLEEAEAVDNSYKTNLEWKNAKIKLAQLAQGLPGRIAEWARRQGDQFEVESVDPSLKPTLDEVKKIMSGEIRNAANSSPLQKNLEPTAQEQLRVITAYQKGKISFQQASIQLKNLAISGNLGYSHDVAIKTEKSMQRAAELRSAIAKSKGFANHTAYALALQRSRYISDFQLPENRIKFLKRLIAATDAYYFTMMRTQARKKAGKNLASLADYELALLQAPAGSLIQQYFPREKIVPIWRETMLASGFAPNFIAQINVDEFPRPGKQNHAYHACVRKPQPKVWSIDARLGDVQLQTQSAAWTTGQSYIVQNFLTDGIGSLTTAFHEGGHAIDRLNRWDIFNEEAAYGYTEMPSKLMEYFGLDREFLFANGETRDGKKISISEIDQFLANDRLNEIIAQRRLWANALFDLELWNYDYSMPGAESFLSRGRNLRAEIMSRVMGGNKKDVNGIPMGDSFFRTNHFISGDVQYFGYVVADMAAELMFNRVLDLLEEKSGRRSIFNQQELAPLLTAFYNTGFDDAFPKSIERFTKQSFSPETYAKSLMGYTAKSESVCAKSLLPLSQ